MSNEFEAQLAFVRDNRDGIGRCSNAARAHFLLDALMREGMTPAELVLRTRHTQFGNALLGSLAQALKAESHWLQAIPTIVREAPRSIEAGEWSKEALLSVLSDKDSQECLLLNRLPELTQYNHPLCGISLDALWSDRVRKYVAEGQLRRAWDQLRFAAKGLPIIDGPTPDYHAVWISSETTIQLVTELYQSMAHEGLVPQIAPAVLDEIRELYVSEPKEERADGRPPDYRSGEYQMIQHMFGLWAAASANPAFIPTSSQVIAIGNHFRRMRNDEQKRRRQGRVVKTN